MRDIKPRHYLKNRPDPIPFDTAHMTIDDMSGQGPLQLRRFPTQTRSRERIDRILDAAAQLLIEKGYSAVKTNHIARRADVSVGSIYQFFPNRYAIFHALALRYLDRISEILSNHLGTDAPDRPWDELIDEVIDILAEMWRSEPAFLAVWLAIQNTAELREADEYYANIFVNDILLNFLRRLLPNVPDVRRQTVGRVMFEVSQRLLDLSMQLGPKQDLSVIEELKRMLRYYMLALVQGCAAERLSASGASQ